MAEPPVQLTSTSTHTTLALFCSIILAVAWQLSPTTCCRAAARFPVGPVGFNEKKADAPRPRNATLAEPGLPRGGAGTIRMVDASATGANNGLSWTDAFVDLQDALDAAASGGVNEIWVAAGTYTPDRGTADRSATFSLQNSLAIYGGFAGSENNRNQRDHKSNVTNLSGAIGQPWDADNSCHVVTANNVNATAILDGFRVIDGYAMEPSCSRERGAGLLGDNADCAILNCSFVVNFAQSSPAAYFSVGCNPVFVNCEFILNSAPGNSTSVNLLSSNGAFHNCVFFYNDTAGAIRAFGGSLTLISCTIVEQWDYGVDFQNCNGTIANSIIWFNASPQIKTFNSNVTVSDSNIEGGYPGDWVLDQDPMFVSLAGDLRLKPGSPCIDTGNTDLLPADVFDLDRDTSVAERHSLDIAGTQRVLDDVASFDNGNSLWPPHTDMGAYEFENDSCLLFGDLNRDGLINGEDIAGYVRAKRQLPPFPNENQDCADFSRDYLPWETSTFIHLLLNQ